MLRTPDEVRRLRLKRREGPWDHPLRLLRQRQWKTRRCAYCRRVSERQLQWDHVEPLSRGGEHSQDNVALACVSCNVSKSDMFLLEWVLSGRAPRPHRPATVARDRRDAVRALRALGFTYQRIAAVLGVSRQRAQQLGGSSNA